MKKILFLITLLLCFATVRAQDTTSCEKAFYEYDVNIYRIEKSNKNWNY